MTANQLKAIISLFIGFVATVIYAVFFGHEYAQGGIEWVQWFVDYGTPFAFFSAVCFGILYTWQALGNNIWEIKRRFMKFSKDICED